MGIACKEGYVVGKERFLHPSFVRLICRDRSSKPQSDLAASLVKLFNNLKASVRLFVHTFDTMSKESPWAQTKEFKEQSKLLQDVHSRIDAVLAFDDITNL